MMQGFNAIYAILLALSLSVAAVAQPLRAPSAFVPPAPGASERKDALYPLEEARVRGWLAAGYPAFVYGEFAGQNAALAKDAVEKGVAHRAAVNQFIGLDGPGFFGGPVFDGEGFVFLGAVESLDATALRLRLDLSSLPAADELWLVAPDIARPFGPYTAADHVEGGLWLPTVFGESAVVAVRSRATAYPALTVLEYAHFYHDFDEETAKGEFPCPVHVACVSEGSFQDASSGIGLIIIPTGGGQGLCSGALINNPATVPLEPFFLTANHCFDSRPNAANLEVKWDFRAPNCNGTGAPSRNSVPASTGRAYLARSAQFDGEFIELHSVPNGDFGRTYLGWDTGTRSVGERVAGIHHPAGEPMKGAFGQITATGVNTFLGGNQNRVVWADGITKGGSSGSPLLLRDDGFIIVGMLSSGNVHNCATPENNFDNYASFRDFFPAIQCFLTTNQACEPDEVNTGLCPLEVAFHHQPAVINALRAFRDEILVKTRVGSVFVDAYYAAAPAITRWMLTQPAHLAAAR